MEFPLRGIDYAASKGISLIIALDCGIKAVEKVEYARKNGIRVYYLRSP
jgi:single-stranded-DNA-specific exonuclease